MKSTASLKGLAHASLAEKAEIRLRHMVDPDGQQLIQEISHHGEVLSSQMPGRYLATYWRGRCENLW